MNRTLSLGFVIALASFVAAPLLGAIEQPLEPVTDPDAYAVYASVLTRVWAGVSKEPLLLQRETEPVDPSAWVETGCGKRLMEQPGWRAVVKNLAEVNSHGPKRLETMLPVDGVYYFISREDIEADDARLTLKYPGQWQRRPESIEYAAVSLVGFNAARDKAIIFDHTRSGNGFDYVALVDGQWVVPTFPFGCGRGLA